MNTRTFALALGVVFLLVGILGFVPAALTHPATGDAHAGHELVVSGYGEGYLLGLFHVNIIHSLIHVLFGIWGIMASRTGGSVLYARSVAIIYAVLAVFGLVPQLNTVFGLVPIHGHDVWLHAGIAAVAAYFGWATTARGEVVTTDNTPGAVG
jgi:hypothetical protein